ncbi:MAG: ABC transporter substrate-binding protein, partial [bacterium]|nr:ABC transporter substrate-binding protein [bacterium]
MVRFAPFRLYRPAIGLALAALLGVGCWAVAAPLARGAIKAGPPRRIVSLNLCADQLLIALADRRQIAGLTHNASDPQMSAEAAAARGLPILHGSAEEVLAIDPDLLIGMPARRNPAIAILKARRYRTVDLKTANDYADIVAAVRSVAAA